MFPLRSSLLALCASALVFVCPVHAEDESPPEKEEPVVLPTYEVLGKRIPRDEAMRVPSEALRAGRATHLGEAMLDVPGVAAVRRGASMTEPVVRGLGWERVVTQFGHLPLYGACPGRMDPPVSYAAAGAIEEVLLVKGLPSVTLGPGGTGGRVVVRTDYERGAEEAAGWEGWLRSWYDAAREGRGAEMGLRGGDRRHEWRAVLEGMNYDDYESPNGVTVPADQEEWSGSLALGWRPRSSARLWSSLSYKRENLIEYPSLPMDLVQTDFVAASVGYEELVLPERAGTLELELGWANIDHVMDNAHKPNRTSLEARTDAQVEGLAALVKLRLELASLDQLSLGIDLSHAKRDAQRERFSTGPGTRLLDRLWPDARQDNLGLFAEAIDAAGARWTLRGGLRLDHARSEATATGDASLGGSTVAESYIRFYGDEARQIERNETSVSGNLLARIDAGRGWSVHAGAGMSTRTAGITERYFAFAPAPGGFLIGNPGLSPEKKLETLAGADYRNRWMSLSVGVYHSWIGDFIHQSTVAREDVNGDGDPDRIRGFENIDARLYGLDGSARLRLGHGLSLPLSFAVVRGLNEDTDGDLPEIPPAQVTAGLRLDAGQRAPWWTEIGARFAARQDRIDAEFGEDETPGFIVLHARAGIRLVEGLVLRLGLENLLDKEYHEHLTREAILPVGDLAAGDELPAPGRSLSSSVRWEF